MKNHALAVLAFVVATFATQALSHFVIATDHYAQVPYIRKEPVFQLGILAMLIQGGILSLLYLRMSGTARTLKRALGFSWSMGAFLVSYMAFAEAAKYSVPSIAGWIGVELASGFVQFSIFGILLAFAHRDR